VSYVVKALRLVYCNPTWDQFAVSNGGDAAIASRVIHGGPYLIEERYYFPDPASALTSI